MLIREMGFTFDGQHSYSHMRMLYAEKDAGHQAWGQVRRNEYQIAGQSGSVLFDGQELGTLTFAGTLYPHEEPESQADAQRMIRRVQKWLLAGRKKLIFDYEPDVYYLAQLTKASQWSLKNWFGGELSITFEAQPYAYAAQESVTSVSGEDEVSAVVQLATLWDAPAVIRVNNAGAEDITEVSINGGKIAFEGLTLAPQKRLDISCEAPIGAEIDGETWITADKEYNPMTYCYNKADNTGNSAALRTTCADLIQYCAAAQTLFGYNTDHLATNEWWSDNIEAVATHSDPTGQLEDITDKGDVTDVDVEIRDNTLEIEGRVEISYRVRPADVTSYADPYDLSNVAGLKLVCTYTDAQGEPKSFEIPASEWSFHNNNLGYLLTFLLSGLLLASVRADEASEAALREALDALDRISGIESTE